MLTGISKEEKLELLHDIFRDRRANGASIPVRDEIPLMPHEAKWLQNKFKTCQSGLSTLGKYAQAVSKQIGAPEGISFYIDTLKGYERAAEKMHAEGRRMNDLGRGRVFYFNIEQAQKFIKLFEPGKNSNPFHELWAGKGVTLIEDSRDNYIRKPRKSGYAGSFNFDVEVDCGKGRKGEMEIQFIHFNMVETYNQSRIFYELIRIFDEMKRPLTEDEQLRKDILVEANAALWDQAFLDEGLPELRKDGHIDTPDAQIVSFAKNPYAALNMADLKRKQSTVHTPEYHLVPSFA